MKQLLSANRTLTLRVGDGFFGCGHPESPSSPSAFFIICSLFLLVGCDDSVFVTTSFLELNTLSVVDAFFLDFFLLFSSSSPVLLWTTAFGGLSDVDVLDFVLTL